MKVKVVLKDSSKQGVYAALLDSGEYVLTHFDIAVNEEMDDPCVSSINTPRLPEGAWEEPEELDRDIRRLLDYLARKYG